MPQNDQSPVDKDLYTHKDGCKEKTEGMLMAHASRGQNVSIRLKMCLRYSLWCLLLIFFFSDGIFLKTFFVVVVEGGIPGRVSCQLLSV